MSSESERQFLDKIIAYANLSGLSDQLYLARLVALGLKDTGDVFFEDQLKGEYFLCLVSLFKEAKDKKYFSIIAPVGSRSYYEQYIPDPLLESDNKKLTTRNKSLTTRNRNLNSENKILREENQLLQTKVDRLSSGEELQAQKALAEQLEFEKANLIEALTNALEETKTAYRESEEHRIEASRLRRESSSYQSQLNQASLDLAQRIRLGRIARNVFLVFLSVLIALGFYVSSRFSDLEESFNDRLSAAEDRITDAEDRAKEAESQTTRKVQEALKSGTDSGYKSGYSEGYEEGKFDMYCWLEEKLIEAKQLIASLRAQLDDLNEQQSSTVSKTDSERPTDNQSSSSSDSQSESESDISAKLAERSEEIKNMIEDLEKRQGDLETSQNGSNHSGGTSSGSGSSSGVSSGTTSDDNATTSYTVYITDTGTKYHLGSCSYLNKSKIAIDRAKAISQGYTACSRCNP